MKFEFKHHGRTYQLVKRVESRDANWYIRVYSNGSQFLRSTDTNQSDLAVPRAKQIIDEVRGGKWATAASKHGSLSVDLAEIRAAYMLSPVKASLVSRRRVLRCLDLVTGGRLNVQVDRQLVKDWYAKAALKMEGLSQAKQRSKMVSANSIIKSAVCVFTPRAMEYYRDNGLAVPDMAPVMEAIQGRRFALPRAQVEVPSDAIINTTLADDVSLSPGARLAVGLMLSFGLRKGEAAQADWSWIRDLDGFVVIDGICDVKNGSGGIFTRAIDPYFTQFLRAHRRASGFVIPGNRKFRTDEVFREVGSWLRKNQWATMKSNHALRALYGGCVALRWGVEEASRRLRHNDLQVTQSAYMHFLDRRRLADPASSGIQWAPSTPALTPVCAPEAARTPLVPEEPVVRTAAD